MLMLQQRFTTHLANSRLVFVLHTIVYRRALLASIFLFLGFWLAQTPTHACTLISDVAEDDSRILVIGEVRDHTIESFEGRQVFGVVVKPFYQYRADKENGVEEYRLFPYGIGADCSTFYFAATDQLREQYSIGRLVTVVGYETTEAIPGNLALGVGSGIEYAPDYCTATDIAEEKLQYPIDPSLCGSDEFHVFKEVGRLATVSEAEARAILRSLSQTDRSFGGFEQLVETYVSSEFDRQRLLKLRYAEAMRIGCAVEPRADNNYDEGYDERREARFRWYEYCTDERQEKARKKY